MSSQKPFLLGPFLAQNVAQNNARGRVICTEWCLEFSTEEERFIIPIYLRKHEWHPEPELEDYMFHERDCPFDLNYREYEALSTEAGDFISVARLIGTMYDLFSPSNPISKTVDEFAERLQFKDSRRHEVPDSALLVTSLADKGYAVESVMEYGDSVRVEFCWIAPATKIGSNNNCRVYSGGIKLLPHSDGSLGSGKWIEPRTSTPSFHLFKVFQQGRFKRPIDCLSAGGLAKCFATFKWEPRHTTPKAELEAKRMALIRSNSHLWGDARALAQLLKNEGLYSAWTSESQIRKTVVKMISKLSITDSGHGSG